MNYRPLVHIGMPKCASTWLQKHFFNPKHGFQPVLDPLFTYLKYIEPRSFEWQGPREPLQIENEQNLVPVLSAEALVGSPLAGGANGETNMYRIKASFPDAKILIVIREQSAMIRSLYHLLVNWGSPYKIETLLYNDLAGNVPRFEPRFLFYDNIIRSYQRQFGTDSVLVVPMEQFQTDPETFLERIIALCDLDVDRFPIKANIGQRENAKRSLVSLEIKRFYNRYIARTKFSLGGLYTPVRIQGKGNLNPSVPDWLNSAMEDRFAMRVQRMIKDLYMESNARTQDLSGLSLAQYGYQLPETQSP